jgi:DNA-binding response OmpR family regulator
MPSVLIVEDEVLTALMYQEELENDGWDVWGPAYDVPRAHRVLDAGFPDAALLDINVQGDLVWPIAARLHEARVPFLFVSAHSDRTYASPRFVRAYERLDKPVNVPLLLARLTALVDPTPRPGRETGRDGFAAR